MVWTKPHINFLKTPLCPVLFRIGLPSLPSGFLRKFKEISHGLNQTMTFFIFIWFWSHISSFSPYSKERREGGGSRPNYSGLNDQSTKSQKVEMTRAENFRP